MEALDNEIKEFIELHTLLSGEYAKCPLSMKDLKFYADSFSELLRARLHQWLQTGERRKAENLISELLTSRGGLARTLSVRLRNVTVRERRLFNREYDKRYPPRPGVPSKGDRQRAARTAYEELERSMGQDRRR